MKLVLCGKGGCVKSTLSALLAEEFIRNTLANTDQIVGVIPASAEIASAGLKGRELVGEYKHIKELAQTILIKLK